MIKTPIDISLDPFNDENTDYLDDECADYFLDHNSIQNVKNNGEICWKRNITRGSKKLT
jgi:hypothetical protein